MHAYNIQKMAQDLLNISIAGTKLGRFKFNKLSYRKKTVEVCLAWR